MGIDQLVSGGDVTDPVYDSVETDDLDIGGNDFVASGDRFVIPYPAVAQGSKSTTSSTFTTAGGAESRVAVDLSSIPSELTLEMRMAFLTWGTMDAEGDYRGKLKQLNNQNFLTPTETVGSGELFAQNKTGTVEITERGIGEFEYEFRSDGTNTITISSPYPIFEVVL